MDELLFKLLEYLTLEQIILSMITTGAILLYFSPSIFMYYLGSKNMITFFIFNIILGITFAPHIFMIAIIGRRIKELRNLTISQQRKENEPISLSKCINIEYNNYHNNPQSN